MHIYLYVCMYIYIYVFMSKSISVPILISVFIEINHYNFNIQSSYRQTVSTTLRPNIPYNQLKPDFFFSASQRRLGSVEVHCTIGEALAGTPNQSEGSKSVGNWIIFRIL